MAIVGPVSRTIISTPIWGFPVTDEVNRLTSEGAANVAKLSTLQATMNKLLTPVWTPMTLNSGFAAYGSGYATPAYCVQGSWVWFRGLVRNTAASDLTTTTNLTTLPSEAYPQVVVQLLVMWLAGSAAGVAPGKRMTVGVGGVVQLYAIAADPIVANGWIALDGIKYNMLASV